ncbi:MAG: hypothetical protein HY319_31065 [Armatimonadetes bacterium]|nr:hypothetical protein [Armatimonadota bacterium]
MDRPELAALRARLEARKQELDQEQIRLLSGLFPVRAPGGSSRRGWALRYPAVRGRPLDRPQKCLWAGFLSKAPRSE